MDLMKLYSCLESLLIDDVAMEADDITKQVNDILGGAKAPANQASGGQREEEEDLTRTDNLFDDLNGDNKTQNPQENPTADNKDDNTPDQNDDNPQDDNAAQDDAADPDGDSDGDGVPNINDPDSAGDGDNPDSGDDNPDDGLTDDPNGDNSTAEKSIYSDKNTLKKNMMYFFNIIRYNINSLEESISFTDNQETIRIINSVIHNMYSIKDVLYDLLTTKMDSLSYEELTTKYITVKRIYDISCDILDEHFKANPTKKPKYKRLNNKRK